MIVSNLMIVALVAVAQLIGDMTLMPYISALGTLAVGLYKNRNCTYGTNAMKSIVSTVAATILGFFVPIVPVVGSLAMIPIVGSIIVGAGKGIGYIIFNDYVLWLWYHGSC